MIDTEKNGCLIDEYSIRLLDMIQEKATGGPRSYGFEYEFISTMPLTLDHMEKLYRFLPEKGFIEEDGGFNHSSGMYINFEPGGQIEYHSTPLYPEDTEKFSSFLELMVETNTEIAHTLDILYTGKGYFPGRKTSPLCLTASRYKNLHARLSHSSTRGWEMMKGTASIHLHAAVDDISKFVPLFLCMCRLSSEEEFRMQPDRRNIWDNTDPYRCGLPYHGINENSEPIELVKELVRIGFEAATIDENIPFKDTQNISFDAFMYQMTTIFTDVRLNIKGFTLELRTLDSIPIALFERKWLRFLSLLEEF